VLECVDKLKNPPIVTQTQVVVEDRLDYPAITFCYKNTEKQGYDRLMIEVRADRKKLEKASEKHIRHNCRQQQQQKQKQWQQKHQEQQQQQQQQKQQQKQQLQ
jgi:putative protein kinase ArgK-like GTPase of G3E family